MTAMKSDKKKKVTVKKSTLKDLKVGKKKEDDVKGGGTYHTSKTASTGPGCC